MCLVGTCGKDIMIHEHVWFWQQNLIQIAYIDIKVTLCNIKLK